MEQRYDAVTTVTRDALSISDIAAKFNVSRQTVYRWLGKYEEGGLEALAAARSPPDGRSTRGGGPRHAQAPPPLGAKAHPARAEEGGFRLPESHGDLPRIAASGPRRQGEG